MKHYVAIMPHFGTYYKLNTNLNYYFAFTSVSWIGSSKLNEIKIKKRNSLVYKISLMLEKMYKEISIDNHIYKKNKEYDIILSFKNMIIIACIGQF